MKGVLIGLKWLGLVILAIIILVVIGSMINHRIRLAQEKTAFPPLGRMVTVNGHQMHVYSQGAGYVTLVFIAGSGTSSPAFNFKPLYDPLSDEYRITVIERAGYGWSETGSTPRDIDTLLSENRKALELAGITPPYVIFAHSMGALEAIAWANQFPHEVLAIIGLDPAVPETYRYLQKPPAIMINLMAFLSRTGITRLSPDVCDESLSPDIPLLFFISDGTEVGTDNWRSLLAFYIDAAPQGQSHLLDVGHYIHNHEPELIGTLSHKFIQDVLQDLK